jgi:glycosyltransferase involved in cell wall biosynthesis
MRIVLFTNAYKPTISGVVTSLTLFRQGLIEAGHDVFIIAPQYEDYVDDEPYIFRFPALDLTGQFDMSLALPIKNLLEPTIRGLKPHVIHSQHPILMGDLAVTFARDLQVPFFFTFHTQYDQYAQHYIPLAPALAGRVMEEVVQRYLKRCEHLIVPSESIQKKVKEQYKLDRTITVVPTPVDLSLFRSGSKSELRAELGWTDVQILLYVGRIAKEKKLDMLLDAFALIADRNPDARLAIVGRGPHKDSLMEKARRMGISGKVEFIGAVTHEQVPRYMAAADLFVFTSTTDTQGLVLIEAMASGTPVVAVNAPGPMDVLRDCGGILTEAAAKPFAEAVSSLLDRPERLQELSKQACELAQRYGIRAATERLLHVYETALEQQA